VRTLTALISDAAGVMLVASFFSLLQPAIELAEARTAHTGRVSRNLPRRVSLATQSHHKEGTF
jgi:zinc transporter ZupT